MIQIYHNNRCSKSRQGLDILEASGKEFNVVDYLKAPPTVAELTKVISLLGIEALDLVRKNEAIWKSDYKGKTFSNQELIGIMVNNPKLIERPIVIANNTAVIGRPPECILDIL